MLMGPSQWIHTTYVYREWLSIQKTVAKMKIYNVDVLFFSFLF